MPPAADQGQRLAEGHRDLYDFLRSSPDSIVYVSTGSVVELFAWQVEAIFHGLKEVGCRVVWSLKEDQQEYLPCKDDPQFFVSKWTPQAALLQWEAVRVVVTHCGWGGTLECVTCGKPVVAMPFFGDQAANAQLLVTAGAGEFIGKLPGEPKNNTRNPYEPGDVTPATVSAAVRKVLADERYAAKMGKLATASRACGGAEAAGQQIEWAAKFGTAHLHCDIIRRTCGTCPLMGVVFGGVVGLCTVAGLLIYARTRILKR